MRVCLDFDGVVHSYESGWKGATKLPDAPVEGAFEAIENYINSGIQVAIFSSRSHQPGAIAAMKKWFKEHGFSDISKLDFPTYKPPSILYIDDRGFHFEGTFPDVEYIKSFKPWNKK